MTIETQNHLNQLFTSLKPQDNAPYLALENNAIVHTANKPQTRIREVYRHITAQLNGDDHLDSCRTIACCDNDLATLEGIEQHLYYYQRNFLAKVNNKALAPLILRFNKRVQTTQAAYHDAVAAVSMLRNEYVTQWIHFSSIKKNIDEIFDEARIENKKLTIEELITGTHLALNKAIHDPEWREKNVHLLQDILDIVYDATDTTQLTYEQIKPLIPLFEQLEHFFGTAVVWTIIPVTNRETDAIEEISVPKLSFLAGPSNNLLS